MKQPVRLIECPRDAMQGWARMIPARQKVQYLQTLLEVGFHTLDFGSFVSPKAVPQMADTREVVKALSLANTQTKLLAIVANTRGADEAAGFDKISYLGFPFSVSETFQHRNTNSSIAHSLETVGGMAGICEKSNKELVVYISMGFGNPYGDPYSEEGVIEWVDKLVATGVTIISLADTVGLATAAQVSSLVGKLKQKHPSIETGVHLHAAPGNFTAKLEAAVEAGCDRFDGALMGIGGCPMANDVLVGNMDMEKMIAYFKKKDRLPPLSSGALARALAMAREIFQ